MGVEKRRPIASLETNYMKQQEVSMRRAAKRKKLLIRRLTAFLILVLTLSYFVLSTFISSNKVLEAKRKKSNC
ncbi:hypothetical protein ACI2OX_00360 [Bacillus sp. N9]